MQLGVLNQINSFQQRTIRDGWSSMERKLHIVKQQLVNFLLQLNKKNELKRHSLIIWIELEKELVTARKAWQPTLLCSWILFTTVEVRQRGQGTFGFAVWISRKASSEIFDSIVFIRRPRAGVQNDKKLWGKLMVCKAGRFNLTDPIWIYKNFLRG